MTDQTFPLFGADAEPAVPWVSVAKIWWLVTWRATVGSMATGMTIGIVISVAGILLGWPPLVRTTLVVTTGSVVVLVWHFVAMRIALQKIYADFRLNASRAP